MDLLTATLILCVILSASAAAYFFALSRGQTALIEKLNEFLAVEREETRHWQNKALFVNRLTPLGKETEPRKEKDPNQKNLTPRVATLAQRRARTHEQSPSITIHANEIVAPNINETVEKAKEIMAQAEMNGT